jgi:hypothetical protein
VRLVALLLPPSLWLELLLVLLVLLLLLRAPM